MAYTENGNFPIMDSDCGLLQQKDNKLNNRDHTLQQKEAGDLDKQVNGYSG